MNDKIPQGDDLRRRLGTKLAAETSAWSDVVQVLRQGVIVKVRGGRINRSITLEKDDLGLTGLPAECETFMQEYVKLGRKALFPAEEVREIDRVERAARRILEKHSIQTAWGRFVPVTAFDEWQREHDQARRDYEEVAANLMVRYETVKARVAEDYRRAGLDLWEKLSPTDQLARDMGQEMWAEYFSRKVVERIPSFEKLKEKCRMEERISYVPLPREAAEEELEAARLRAEAATLKGEARAEVEARARMAQAVAQHAVTEKTSMIDDFLRDVAGQLRGMVYDVASNVLEQVQGKGKLHSSGVVQLKNLVESLEKLNFYGDSSVQEQIERIEAILVQKAEDRHMVEVENILEQVQAASRMALVDIGVEPRRTRRTGEVEVVQVDGGERRQTRRDGGEVEVGETGGVRRQRRAS